uniref:Uncharacterized protein n=1 Tax=Glossina brevipalpis TaxID=37001 RepID=A0A1A9X5G0_9MUSC
MWKKLEICEETFFMNCVLIDNERIACILLSLKKCWSATLTLNEIKEKVKLLNKRVEYNDYVKDTLLNGDLNQASLEELPPADEIGDGTNRCLLKAKYRVEELPLKFEWSLTKTCTEEFQRNYFIPLLLTADSYKQQVQDLKSIIQKKDEEIKQYRREGFSLRRSTVVTIPFDVDDFNKHTDHKFMYNFDDLSKCVLKLQEADKLKNDASKSVMPLSEVKNDVKLPSMQKNGPKKSPKQRKRRMQEIKQEKLKNVLRPVRKSLRYETQSSQSSNNSQTVLEQQKINKIKGNSMPRLITGRRITRSTGRSLGEPGIESENNSSKNVANTDLNENPISSGGQRTLPSNLVYSPKRETKSPVKEYENNTRNVFDFSTDSDRETEIIVQRKKSKGNKGKKSGNFSNEVSETIENLAKNSNKRNDDVSSQLETIKKGLQELETLRLEDLKKRRRNI